jgi:uncharacterized protein (DUF924 family)
VAVRGNIHEAIRAHGAIVAKMPPDLSHRAEMLLEFWFAPEGPSERDQLRDIWFQATPEFDAALAYAALPEHPDKGAFAEAARRHHEIIARFGRFPHRNGILGRPSTPEERDFLQQPGSPI